MGKVAKIAAGSFIALKAIDFVASSFREAGSAVMEQDKLLAQTNAVLKSTGNAANVTAKDVLKLSDAIEKKSLIDAEQIQNGQNVLLTFTKIQNSAGRGNKIFNRATQAAADLSTALGTDMKSSAVLVGKALNDPIKGVSALSKSGVQFTQKQKDMIKTLVESGDTLKAQKIILKELDTQFAGSAEAAGGTFAGKVKHLKDTWDGFMESLVRAVIPVLDRVVTLLSDKLPGAIASVQDFIGRVRGAFSGFGGDADGAGSRMQTLLGTITTVWTSIQSIFQSGVTIVTALWARFGGTITSFLSASLTNALNVVRGAFTVLQGLFKIVSGVLSGDWSRVWSGIKSVVSGAWAVIKAVVSQGVNVMKTLVRVGLAAVRGIFSGAWNAVRSLTASAWNGIRSAVSRGASGVVSFVKGIPGKIKGAFSGAGSLLSSVGRQIIEGLIGGIKAMADRAVNAAKDVVGGAIKGAKKLLGINSPSRVFRTIGTQTMDGLILGLEGQRRSVLKTVEGVARDVSRTPIGLSLTDAKGKLSMAAVGSYGGPVTKVYNITIQMDSSMTVEEQGRAYKKAIAAAERVGL